jgi:phosphoribosylformylglycinamidine synthase
MGIPTVGGEVFFHPSFQGNPLVNAMSVGLLKTDKIFRGKASGVGNIVMLVGSRTGRDGIKGASFASEELSDKDADKRHNVQVGDPFMEKLLLEATLEILDADLVVGLQDLGAAGLTSSGCEMASRAKTGLYMDLDKVPLREQGLADWEMMLSESQERMLLIVEPSKVQKVQNIFEKWDLLATNIGKVTDDGCFTLKRGEKILASIPALYLTEKAPVYNQTTTEPAYYQKLKNLAVNSPVQYEEPLLLLRKLLASPNLSSKHWIYEQYDTTVMLNTVLGPAGDAALLRIPYSQKGLALTTDCNSRYVYLDPYWGTAIAVAEAALNIAVTGAKPLAITNCLNFGNPENTDIFWQFVKATDGLADATRHFETPVTGGNVSFYNEYDGRAIYPTPVIGMVGLLENIDHRISYHFKNSSDLVILVGKSLEELGASEAHYLVTGKDEGPVPALDFELTKRVISFLLEAASSKILVSAHDVSDGGLAIALLEAAMPLELGLNLKWHDTISTGAAFFGETQSRVIVSLNPEKLPEVTKLLQKHNLPFTNMGTVTGDGTISLRYNDYTLQTNIAELKPLWLDSLKNLSEI